MKSHELAKLLLDFPNLPIAIGTFGHVYASATDIDSHCTLKIGLLETYGGQHLVIGNNFDNLECSNRHVSKILHTESWDVKKYIANTKENFKRKTGDIIFTIQETSSPRGWILINKCHNSIGGFNSLASYADDKLKKLFILFWNHPSDSVFEIIGGKGKSALADFKAGKTMFFLKINYPFLIKL